MADAAVRAGPTALSSTAATIYDPGAAGAILKYIHVSNEHATTTRFVTVSIGTDAAGKRIINAAPVESGNPLLITVWLPLTDADIIQAKQDTGTDVNVTLGLVTL